MNTPQNRLNVPYVLSNWLTCILTQLKRKVNYKSETFVTFWRSMHPRRFLYCLLPKCCQDLKRKLKNKIISELARKGFADRQVEPGKGNRIPESGGILLVESGVQLKESRIRDGLGFHYMGRDKFVSPLIVRNTFMFPMSTSKRSKFL